jgi:hypothetical protein
MTTASVDDVRAMLQLPPADSTDLSPFLDSAEVVVTEDLVGTLMTDERKRLISIYLAAHFATLAIERGGLTRLKTGTSEEEYNTLFGRSDQGFRLTRYGQQAVALDTSGILDLMSRQSLQAEFRVV